MEVLFVNLSNLVLKTALFVGQLTANAACFAEFYQPKVPNELKR